MIDNSKRSINSFTKPTLYFCLVGFIAVAFPAYVLLGLEYCLEKLGYSCENAILSICKCATYICLITPVTFFYYLFRSRNWFSISQIKRRILLFDLTLYVCIPAALEIHFSTPQILCNVTDGQNGLELAFSAWLALPVVMLLSVVFEQVFKGRSDVFTSV